MTIGNGLILVFVVRLAVLGDDLPPPLAVRVAGQHRLVCHRETLSPGVDSDVGIRLQVVVPPGSPWAATVTRVGQRRGAGFARLGADGVHQQAGQQHHPMTDPTAGQPIDGVVQAGISNGAGRRRQPK
jgi:hypothetical protein